MAREIEWNENFSLGNFKLLFFEPCEFSPI